MPHPTKVLTYLTALAAETPKVGNARVAAALMRGNEWISVATNKNKTHPTQARFAKNNRAIYLHAEIHAIVKALRSVDVKELKYCDLYIARVAGINKEVASVSPCIGCAKAIREFGIKRIYCT